MPRAVLFAGPQKHTAMVSSGERRLNIGSLQGRDARMGGGRELMKQTSVRAMYKVMLNNTTNITLCVDRAWRAPVAKHEEKVVLLKVLEVYKKLEMRANKCLSLLPWKLRRQETQLTISAAAYTL